MPYGFPTKNAEYSSLPTQMVRPVLLKFERTCVDAISAQSSKEIPAGFSVSHIDGLNYLVITQNMNILRRN
jgi:hypothetical protein